MSDKPIKGILNSRVADSGATEYKVRFAGCDKSEDAWVPEDTVAPAQVRTAHHSSEVPLCASRAGRDSELPGCYSGSGRQLP
jgi:hypothetical protein